MLPPFGAPAGDPVDDDVVLRVFIHGEATVVHSPQFHTEGSVLVTAGDVATAIRIGPRTFLVRLDLPGEQLEEAKRTVEEALAADGIGFLDGDTLLAAPIAIQLLGLRLSTWDLWGADIDEAFKDLRTAAAGEWDDVFPEGPPPVPGPS